MEKLKELIKKVRIVDFIIVAFVIVALLVFVLTKDIDKLRINKSKLLLKSYSKYT